MAIALACAAALLASCKPELAAHPVVGTWTLTTKDSSCVSTHVVRRDGIMAVASGERTAEVEYEITPAPSDKGFYRWTERNIRDNSKPDCLGSIRFQGDSGTRYIKMDPGGQSMLVCAAESTDLCIGPLVRGKE